MGLFKKKEDKKPSANARQDSAPRLPELPKLPSLPEMGEELDENMELPKLPSFPNSSTGDKFSQNTIKEAVAGEKEVTEEYADDSMNMEEDQMMPNTLQEEPEMRAPSKREMPSRINNPIQVRSQYTQNKTQGPVFIRLDKFEDSLEIFKEAKEQISEIQDLLNDIKELKQKEESELNDWENQIQEIKNQIDKVDQDIFSKI